MYHATENTVTSQLEQAKQCPLMELVLAFTLEGLPIQRDSSIQTYTQTVK